MIPDQIVKELLKEVHERILKKKDDYSINIFLCGAKQDEKNSIRKRIQDSIEIRNSALFNIYLPEELFYNLLPNKRYNLLHLEQQLASDVDVIILPLEGYGTVTELGAFASSPDLIEKMVVINNERYKRKHRSFINIGPIELVRSKNKKNIIYYVDHSLDGMIHDVYKRLLHFRRQPKKRDIKNLFTFSKFLLYLIAIFQPITKGEIEKHLKTWGVGIREHYIDPALQILSQRGNISMDPVRSQETYSLTSEGNYYVYEKLCHELKLTKVVSKMRSEILHFQNRKIKVFDLDKEREKLLGIS